VQSFWTAIIGAVGTIAAALITGLFSRQASVRNKSYDKVTGSISEPQPNDSVPRTLKCSGVATGMQSGLSLWLAVEVGDLVWPKESKLVPDHQNKWSATVFEDGATQSFAIALYLSDSTVDRRIEKWLEAGRSTGTYTDLRGIPGARRIARVDGLRLNPRASEG
jgi:hypothetical protein